MTAGTISSRNFHESDISSLMIDSAYAALLALRQIKSTNFQ